MKPQSKQIVIVLLSIFLLSCSTEETLVETAVTPQPATPPTTAPNPEIPIGPISKSINYLALGDSYTIG